MRLIVIRGVYFERSIFTGAFGIANNNAATVSVLFTVNLRFVAIAGENNRRIRCGFRPSPGSAVSSAKLLVSGFGSVFRKVYSGITNTLIIRFSLSSIPKRTTGIFLLIPNFVVET